MSSKFLDGVNSPGNTLAQKKKKKKKKIARIYRKKVNNILVPLMQIHFLQ